MPVVPFIRPNSLQKNGMYVKDGQVWVDNFLEYQEAPYAEDYEGVLYKMYFCLVTSSGYVLERYYHPFITMNGVTISEKRAFSLLRPEVRQMNERGTIIIGPSIINCENGVTADESERFRDWREPPAALPPMQYVIFKDSRNAWGTNIPWEMETENEPIFVMKFVAYDGMPFIIAEPHERGFPDVWHLIRNDDAYRGYVLEKATGSIVPDVLFKSSLVTEQEAFEMAFWAMDMTKKVRHFIK